MKQKARLPRLIDSVHKLCVLHKKSIYTWHSVYVDIWYTVKYIFIYSIYIWEAGKTQYIKRHPMGLRYRYCSSLYRFNYSGCWGMYVCYSILISLQYTSTVASPPIGSTWFHPPFSPEKPTSLKVSSTDRTQPRRTSDCIISGNSSSHLNQRIKSP